MSVVADTRKGFSLLEVMIAGTLSSMIMLGVTGGVIQTQRHLKQAKSVMGVQSLMTQVRASLTDPSTCHQALAAFSINQVSLSPMTLSNESVSLQALGQFESFPGTAQAKWMPLLIANQYAAETSVFTKAIRLKRVPDSIDSVLADGSRRRLVYIELEASRVLGLYKAGETYPTDIFSGFYQEGSQWSVTPDTIQLYITLNALNQMVACSLDHPAAPAVATTRCEDIDHDALWVPSAAAPRKACQIRQLELNAQGDAAPARLTFGDYGGTPGSFPSISHVVGGTDVRVLADTMRFSGGTERVTQGVGTTHTGDLTVNGTLSVYTSGSLLIEPAYLNRFRHATTQHRLRGALNGQRGGMISRLRVIDTAEMGQGSVLTGEGTASIGGRLYAKGDLNVVNTSTLNGPITTRASSDLIVRDRFRTSQNMLVLGNVARVRDIYIPTELQVGGVLRRGNGVEILTNNLRNSTKAALGGGPAIEFDWGVHMGNQGGDILYDCGWNFAELSANRGMCNAQHTGMHAQMDCVSGDTSGGVMSAPQRFDGSCSSGPSMAYIFCCTR